MEAFISLQKTPRVHPHFGSRMEQREAPYSDARRQQKQRNLDEMGSDEDTEVDPVDKEEEDEEARKTDDR